MTAQVKLTSFAATLNMKGERKRRVKGNLKVKADFRAVIFVYLLRVLEEVSQAVPPGVRGSGLSSSQQLGRGTAEGSWERRRGLRTHGFGDPGDGSEESDVSPHGLQNLLSVENLTKCYFRPNFCGSRLCIQSAMLNQLVHGFWPVRSLEAQIPATASQTLPQQGLCLPT